MEFVLMFYILCSHVLIVYTAPDDDTVLLKPVE
jgi:hypothetical protein